MDDLAASLRMLRPPFDFIESVGQALIGFQVMQNEPAEREQARQRVAQVIDRGQNDFNESPTQQVATDRTLKCIVQRWHF
jgi:hypothetical protein